MNWFREFKKQFKEWREDRAWERARMRQIHIAIEQWHRDTQKLRNG